MGFTVTVSAMSDDSHGDKLRIDRWLWCTRFFKTRSAAAQAVRSGRVRLNGQRVKPSREITIGDKLVIDQRLFERILTITALPSRRGPASEAMACYVESEESLTIREKRLAEYKANREISQPATRGKPDKHTRRLIRSRVRGRNSD